ncbi:MAG: HAMP domain-containing histidine kinase [Chloroflexi bacterium]|nr:HAMP domain-containing histidine kinase [Chloroflexota bacterium]
MDSNYPLPERRTFRAGSWWARSIAALWLRRGVRLQLTAWYGAALIVLLVVLGALVYWLLSTNLRRDAEAQLKARASQIVSTLNVDEGSGGSGIEGGINFQDTQAPGELVLIYSDKGVLLESAGGSQNVQGYRPSTLPSWANPGNGLSALNSVDLSGGRWLMYAVPIPRGESSGGSAGAGGTGGRGGTGWLIVEHSIEPMYRMLTEMLSALALAGPLVILLACIGGYFMAGRALAPVSAITRTAQRIQAEGLGSGHTSRIGMQGRRDELGELASTFDAMLARIGESFKRERRFTADAAHELRTPLAVVQAETSLALARPRRVTEYQRVLAVVEGEAARMGKLVTDLLTLARADEGQHHLAHDAVDLSSLCQSVICQVSALASNKGISLIADIQEDVTVEGDTIWLAQMLLNLMDNGIKYTQAGGWVKVQLTSGFNKVEVSVADSGIGINNEQLPHIFDRFYRADKSRTRDSETAGLGLGLAICDWIAKSYGGSITVSSNVGRGSCFVVHLPQPPSNNEDNAMEITSNSGTV